MNLDEITPVILTFNEEVNIGRTLAKLQWAKDVVVVDSNSTDQTAETAKGFSNVRFFGRRFDSHAKQWNYAAHETGISTPWVLTLDADYILPDGFIAEIESLVPETSIAGYEAQFRFCIHGRTLPRSILPGRIVLFRRDKGVFYQDGHTQRVRIEGGIRPLHESIDHDDRKSLSHWIAAQDRYVHQERDKLLSSSGSLSLPDRIRQRMIVAPLLVLFHCLIVKRLIFAGLPGWHYTYQRVMAEILLSLYLIEQRLTNKDAKQ